MFLSVICLLLCSILTGVIIGLLIARSVISQRLLDADMFWRAKLAKINEDWRDFHRNELDKWQTKTTALIHKTYQDTIEERDRAWEKRLSGTKLKGKPKPTN